MAKKVFVSMTSTNSVEDDESVDVPSPILPSLPDLKEHLQNLQLDIVHNNLNLGDLDSGPAKPILEAYPKTSFGSQNRAFSSTLYNQFEWLEYNILKDSVSGSKGKGKNCKSKLEVHSSSPYHLTCMAKWSAHKKSKITSSVHTLLTIANREDTIKNRNYIKCITDIILYLSRQGIAFRGHLEDKNSLNKGNFKEACKLYFKHNSDFQNQYEKFINYTSATTQNTIIEICSNYVLDYIINQVKSADFYSIMSDYEFAHNLLILTFLLLFLLFLHIYFVFLEQMIKEN
ncbi:hypothetical protein AGLY_004232 [Aphis glycines]|uniref:Uncharacterized protein n=1 Tax=Aphis glycines TaxID=307491 RepID=A0A6G0TZY3_APHGL|nr:hypothetical protein AGLY_004232 [Aphis glycines]